MIARRTLALSAILASAGCASGSVVPSAAPNGAVRATALPTGNYIKHVVIVVQENRSFDNIFSGFPNADAATFGCSARKLSSDAASSGSGCPAGDTKVALHQITFDGYDVGHGWDAAMADWHNGKMDGFYAPPLGNTGKPAGSYPYAYLSRTLVAPYWAMARQYVLADHMFATMFGGSFTAHLDLIASTASLSAKKSEVDLPTASPEGCDAPPGTLTHVLNTKRVISQTGPFPCFTQFNTMAETLDAAHVSWKYYAPPIQGPPAGGALWSEFDAIKAVRDGPDWAKNVESASPQTKVLSDISSGHLPQVSWVIPDVADSDHAGPGHSDAGPSWVAAVVNKIGESKYWKSTAVIVVWDDWGGWYDHLPPPQLDYRGLGIRVPCIIISPYVKAHVTHTQYEFGSILRFVEDAFKLNPLGPTSFGYTDTRAADLVGDFDFTQKPRTFVKIPAKYPISHFVEERPSMIPPDTE